MMRSEGGRRDRGHHERGLNAPGLPHPRHPYQRPGPGRGSRRMPSSRAGVSHKGPFSRPFLNDCQSFADESMIALKALGRRAARMGEDVSVQRFVRRAPHPAAAAITSRAGRLRQLASGWSGQALTWTRSSWVDIAWVAFVAINLVAMRLLPVWQTIPFLAIWVSLTAIYGFRLWRIQPTILTLAAVTIATGGIIGVQVLKGQQDADYLAEVPLIALMFLVMVWHGRRRLAATEEQLAAMEEVQRVSEE